MLTLSKIRNLHEEANENNRNIYIHETDDCCEEKVGLCVIKVYVIKMIIRIVNKGDAAIRSTSELLVDKDRRLKFPQTRH